jgi:hypothetical protein
MRGMTGVAQPERPLAGTASLEPWRLGLGLAEVLALRSRVWGADHPHSRAEFLRWLFGDANPAGRGAGVVLRRSGRVIGFAGLCPRLARVEGRDTVVAHGLDYMVDRSLAAGSGRHALRIAARWAELARAKGFAFGINFPNGNSRRLLTSGRLGWREILSPRLMVRPLRGHAIEGGARAAAMRLGLWVGGAALGAATRLRGRKTEGAARPLDPSPDAGADARAIDGLWLRRRDDTRATLCRDAAALRWRYGDHPIRRYRLLGWEDRNGLSALIVTTRRELEGIPSVLIVDALFDPASPETGRALIGAALSEAAGEGACLAAAEAMPRTALGRALSGAGFVAVPRRLDPKPFTLVGLPLAASPAAAFSCAAWQFAWGDMDVV